MHLSFDKEGNLYAIDTGIAGGLFNPPIATKGGGAYMFPVSSLETLADGQSRRRCRIFQYPRVDRMVSKWRRTVRSISTPSGRWQD